MRQELENFISSFGFQLSFPYVLLQIVRISLPLAAENSQVTLAILGLKNRIITRLNDEHCLNDFVCFLYVKENKFGLCDLIETLFSKVPVHKDPLHRLTYFSLTDIIHSRVKFFPLL